MKENSNIRIEQVGDINYIYPYLEVFYKDSINPFLDIGVTAEKQLNFKFYPNSNEIDLKADELDYILYTAKEFLPEALKIGDDFLKWDQE